MRRAGFCLFAFVAAACSSTAIAQPAAQWATLKGQIVLPADQQFPVRAEVDVTIDKAACLKKGPLYDDAVIVNLINRGVKNVFVWLRPNNPNPKATFAANEIHPGDANRKPADVVIDQTCCQYTPRVIAARVGDTIVVKNSSAVTHGFTALGVQPFGAIEPPPIIQRRREHRFGPLKQATIPTYFGCTIHPWMNGTLRVYDHPYYAVTDDDGKFTIPKAPVGNYALVAWHEKVGYHDGKAGRLGTPIVIQGPTTELPPRPFATAEKW